MPMQQFGYAFIYDKHSKEPLFVAGEIAGLLKEGFSLANRCPEFDPKTMEAIELAYGERRSEVEGMGSWRIDDGGRLVIIPRFTASVDKSEITADGEDTATITVSAPQDDAVTFTVDDTPYEVSTDAEGNAQLDFATEVVGKHFIEINTIKHGRGGVSINAV